ncbi:reverse transcriptase domain-containing protein [Tanacetum coccineum]
MPFVLKNVGATYQRLVDSAFQTQLGRNLEAYVDDMVIKNKKEQEMVMDIAKTFDNLWKINMKLNPMKCLFVVKEGKFLGYMVISERIRANPKKTKAVADMKSPKILKKMQSLSRKLETLNRFLARYEEADNRTPNPYHPYAEGNIVCESGRILRRIGAKHLEIRSLTGEEANLDKWTLYTDGASSPKGVGAGHVLIDPTGVEYTYAIRLKFPSTNNEGEYEALLADL